MSHVTHPTGNDSDDNFEDDPESHVVNDDMVAVMKEDVLKDFVEKELSVYLVQPAHKKLKSSCKNIFDCVYKHAKDKNKACCLHCVKCDVWFC